MDPIPPNENSRVLMKVLDRLSPARRKLVHEYGANIVLSLLDNGITDARSIKRHLQEWRSYRQREMLNRW